MIDASDPRLVVGTDEDRAKAREEFRRQRFVAEVMKSGLPEIARSRLEPVIRHCLEDTLTGEFYAPRRDQLLDITFTNAVAYFVDSAGTPVLLEKPHGPKNRVELERKQAEREARRNAPKPRRSWVKPAR